MNDAEAQSDDLQQARTGDFDALTRLLEEATPGIKGALHVGSAWQSVIEVDDVLQVTYLEAFVRIRQLRARTRAEFSAWLRQIARNNLRDAIRGLRSGPTDPRRRVQSNEESSTQFLELLVADSHTASRSVAGREVGGILQRAIDELPESYRNVVRLVDLGGSSVREVAGHLGKTDGAVHMLRARAHDRIREILGSASRYF